MRELIGDIELGLPQATAIAKAMRQVAGSDGVHPRETEMIEGFYSVCAREAGQGEAALDAGDFDAADAKATLYSPAHVEALVLSCYLLALADGAISDEEEASIAAIARDLGVDDAQLKVWAQKAKLYLLRQFEGVSLFKDEAISIGRSLGLEDEVIKAALGLS